MVLGGRQRIGRQVFRITVPRTAPTLQPSGIQDVAWSGDFHIPSIKTRHWAGWSALRPFRDGVIERPKRHASFWYYGFTPSGKNQ
jgi:hypothetical protein